MIYPGGGPVGYQRLADILRAQITCGDLRPGQRLPSESTLSQTYGVASKTARAALTQLRNEGLAELVRGYGVVVREQVEPEVVSAAAGSSVSARNPTPNEREELDVPEGVPLLEVTLPDGTVERYPADRYRVEIPPPE
jgi:DNA-binding GntR family transcriptional regulator